MRVTAWLSVSGFVNAEPGYAHTTAVLNAFSEVVLEVFDLPFVVAAEVEIDT